MKALLGRILIQDGTEGVKVNEPIVRGAWSTPGKRCRRGGEARGRPAQAEKPAARRLHGEGERGGERTRGGWRTRSLGLTGCAADGVAGRDRSVSSCKGSGPNGRIVRGEIVGRPRKARRPPQPAPVQVAAPVRGGDTASAISSATQAGAAQSMRNSDRRGG